MGQTLSEPVTEKHTSFVTRGKKYAVAVSDMQGWRISMEDAHSLHLSLPPSPSTPTTKTAPEQPQGSSMSNAEGEDGPAFFGVFDGHGGSAVAKFTGSTIHSRLAALDSYKNGDWEKALKTLYLKTDEDLRANPEFFNDPSGCTAVSALLTLDGKIIVANSGDSRSVLGYKGEAKAMSEDHKPTNTGESARITAAGGFVEFGRVNGNLALSRAIGDFEFKQNYSLEPEKQIVTADPEFTTHQIDGEEEFLVLACDGIWDCLSSQQVVDFVRRAIANGDSLTKVCEDMMVKCLAPDSELGGIGCDNMTVVIVALLNGRTVEEWQQWVKKRVEEKVGYDTPERVADVFGHSNAIPLGGAGGLRQVGQNPLASLQQVLQGSGLTLRPQEDDDSNDGSDDNEGSGSGEGRQDELARFVQQLVSGRQAPQANGLLRAAQSSSPDKLDTDGDVNMDSDNSSNGAKSGRETPPPPSISAEDREKESKPQEQLKSQPGGDAPSGAVKAEGLMDTSEGPL